MSRTIITAILFLLFGIGSVIAQGSCAARAKSEDGKPLAGSARTSFMKKCCEDSALDKDGKPLQGDAKTSYLKRCQGSFSEPEDGRG